MVAMTNTVAEIVKPLVTALLNDAGPVPIQFWDGSFLGTPGENVIVVKSPEAVRRILWAPGELGLGRAYVAGEIDFEGSIIEALSAAQDMAGDSPDVVRQRLRARDLPTLIRTARKLGVLGLPPAPPPEEARVRGGVHSKERDASAIAHHYDVGNDFYRLLLGETMTYSCGYFDSDNASLDEAQTAKHDLICRKLGLVEGMRLLDVGCGWGSMAIHAASRYGAKVVGVTLSQAQVELARERVARAGLSDRIEIRYQDYRDVSDGPYDAVSSIGMFEHVGLSRLDDYFTSIREVLIPGGRFLNHAISRHSGSGALPKRSFIARYVFPDGEFHEVGRVITRMQDLGLEVRDVESLREHYAKTLRRWLANLEGSWSDAVALAGAGRARVWRLYIAASALNFEANRVSIHQVLAVNTPGSGNSEMPATRKGLAEKR
jgi:cyclopropane-fatty-acyl-phospholipid synthase